MRSEEHMKLNFVKTRLTPLMMILSLEMLWAPPSGYPSCPPQLDPSFGSNGTVTTALNGKGAVSAVVVQPDGLYVAGGAIEYPEVSASRKGIVLARYNPGGNLD